MNTITLNTEWFLFLTVVDSHCFFVLTPISVWLMNEWLLGHLWFWFLLVILTLLQTGSVCHLIWFLVSKFYLGKSYTQDTQEDMMPTSEEGTCEILLSETILFLPWQASLQLPWWFTLTVHHETRASESGSPFARCKDTEMWFSSTLSKNGTAETQNTVALIFMNLNLPSSL